METSKEASLSVDLKGFRLANGLTQRDLAEFLEVSPPFICKIEAGQNKLPFAHFTKLIENDKGWETECLTEPRGRALNVNNGIMSIGQTTETAYHSQFNNYQGYSDEEFKKELDKQLEIKNIKIASLESENAKLRDDLAFSQNQVLWWQKRDEETQARIKALEDQLIKLASNTKSNK